MYPNCVTSKRCAFISSCQNQDQIGWMNFCNERVEETFIHSPVVEFVVDEVHLPGMSSTESEMLGEETS